MARFKPTLPPELWKEIFSYLLSCRKDIAACRSVSKEFREWSSEFLIRRVVFAKRLDAIEYLWKVLEHPEFREYVTELVYNASTYEESRATNFENYEDTCDTYSTRVFRDVDAINET